MAKKYNKVRRYRVSDEVSATLEEEKEATGLDWNDFFKLLSEYAKENRLHTIRGPAKEAT